MLWRCRTFCQQFIRSIVRVSPLASLPLTNKEVTKCQNADYLVGAASMQGWRVTMEDSHVHLLGDPLDDKAAYFAVFDGHGGAKTSQLAGMRLHKKIIGSEDYAKNDFHAAIKKGYLDFDEDLMRDPEMIAEMSGSTAVVVLVKNNKIYCGNAGDSRAVLCQRGKTVPLSVDHKPDDPEEESRIVKAGGWVESRRVCGNLALSRALGDFIFKLDDRLGPGEQIVTASPDVVEVELTKEHEFIILACDGIWDVLSSEQAVAFCRKKLKEGYTPERVCEELIDKCLAPYYDLSGLGCDNMTVVLVCLLQGQSKEAYIESMKA